MKTNPNVVSTLLQVIAGAILIHEARGDALTVQEHKAALDDHLATLEGHERPFLHELSEALKQHAEQAKARKRASGLLSAEAITIKNGGMGYTSPGATRISDDGRVTAEPTEE